MLNTKEIYDVMKMFEKSNTSYNRQYDKEDKAEWSKKNYYQNGTVNQLFLSFLNGYAYAKSMATQGYFENA